MQATFSNDQEFLEFKTWTYGILKDSNVNNVRVTFTKKDGTEREMQCTLVQSRIPADKQPTTSKSLEEETNTQITGSAVRVFDQEKEEWRSFRWDSVKQVNFDIGE